MLGRSWSPALLLAASLIASCARFRGYEARSELPPPPTSGGAHLASPPSTPLVSTGRQGVAAELPRPDLQSMPALPAAGEAARSEARTTPGPAAFERPLPGDVLPEAAPARRFANLSPTQCRRMLRERQLPFRRVGEMHGVATALRIDGAILGIELRGPGGSSPYGVLDCRLALALAEMAPLLQRHGVRAIRIDNMYRPNARFGGKRKRSQHSYGLAVDIFAFTFQDGTVLEIEDTWEARLGKPVCGSTAAAQGISNPERRLRNLVCDLVRAGIFHHVLTPHYDRAHANHLHLDIKRGETTYSLN